MESQDPYQKVADEISAGIRDKAIWVRSWSESGGDHSKATALYVRHRVEQLRAATRKEQAAAKDEARWQTKQKRRAATEKYLKGVVRSLVIGVLLLGIIKCATSRPSSKDYVYPLASPAVAPSPFPSVTPVPIAVPIRTPYVYSSPPTEQLFLSPTPWPSFSPAIRSTPRSTPVVPGVLPTVTWAGVTAFVKSFLAARSAPNTEAELTFFADQIGLSVPALPGEKLVTRQQLAAKLRDSRRAEVTRTYKLETQIQCFRLAHANQWQVNFEASEVALRASHYSQYWHTYKLLIVPQPDGATWVYAIVAISENTSTMQP